jgi:ribose transport system substrate-binding protein
MSILRSMLVGIAGIMIGSCGMLLSYFQPKPTIPVIAFVPRTTGTAFTEDMRRGAEQAAKSAGYQIYWNAPTRADDVERQIRIAENAVDKGATALVLAPTNPWGVTTLLQRLSKRHLPIVIVQTESPVPVGPLVSSVALDQREIGRIAAERIAQITGGHGKVAIVGLNHGEPETLERAQSFLHSIESYPDLKVVAQTSGSNQALEIEQGLRDILLTYPNIKVVFAVSADAAQAALLALHDQSLAQKIKVVACDRDLFLSDNLEDGTLDSVVTVSGTQLGYAAVMAVLAGTRGRKLPPPEHLTAVLFTRQDLDRERNPSQTQ